MLGDASKSTRDGAGADFDSSANKASMNAFSSSDIIQPGPRFADAPLPVTDEEWFSYAVKPAADAFIDEMMRIGRTHAQLWMDAQADEAQLTQDEAESVQGVSEV